MTRRLLERLGRIVTPGRRFIPQVDGLRFVAIGTVVLYHVAHQVLAYGHGGSAPGLALRTIHMTGWYGVRLFFALSGFLLALPFARAALAGGRPVSLEAYFLRRLTRLEPPYILMIVAVATLDLLLQRGSMFSLPRLAAALGYQHLQVFGELYPANGATWSLETEVQFYCLTPLLVAVFAIRPTWLRRGIMAAAIVLFAGLANASRLVGNYRWDVCVLGHLHEFLAGYLLADVYVHDWQEKPEPGSVAWDAAAAVGWGLIPVLLVTPLPPLARVALPFIVLLVYVATMRGPVSRWAFSRPWVTAIGGMCYTIYLLHGPVMRFTKPLVDDLVRSGSPERLFVGFNLVWLPLVAIVSLVFFIGIERPCMDPSWPARLAGWLRGRAGSAAEVAPRP